MLFKTIDTVYIIEEYHLVSGSEYKKRHISVEKLYIYR
jgi:hypothetical protein